jgi:phosphoserine aminotransferase
MFNTPPVVPIFAGMKTLEWILQNGGVKEMEKRAIRKSTKLYEEIDRNKLFRGTVREDSRSRMSVCFVMNDEYKDLEAKFLDFVKGRDMVGLKGHRSVGGFRASLYNALPEESVDALVQAMKDFEKEN